MPPAQDGEIDRIDVARKLGTVPALAFALPVTPVVPLLVPTAAVVPLVPVAGFGVAGWLVVGRPVTLGVPVVPLVGDAVPAVAVASVLSSVPRISTC